MKGLEGLIRLHRWRLDEKRRKLADLERLKRDIEGQIQALEVELTKERGAASALGVNDAAGMSFPPYLKAMLQRREILTQSLSDIVRQIAVAQDELTAEFQEVKKYETVAEGRQRRERQSFARRSQAELDQIGIDGYTRAARQAKR